MTRPNIENYSAAEKRTINRAWSSVLNVCCGDWTNGPRMKRAVSSIRSDMSCVYAARVHAMRGFAEGVEAYRTQALPKLLETRMDGYLLAFACGIDQSRLGRAEPQLIALIETALSAHDEWMQRALAAA